MYYITSTTTMTTQYSDYNPNDYQGRRQDQVEASNKAVWWSMIAITLIMVGLIVFKVLN